MRRAVVIIIIKFRHESWLYSCFQFIITHCQREFFVGLHFLIYIFSSYLDSNTNSICLIYFYFYLDHVILDYVWCLKMEHRISLFGIFCLVCQWTRFIIAIVHCPSADAHLIELWQRARRNGEVVKSTGRKRGSSRASGTNADALFVRFVRYTSQTR